MTTTEEPTNPFDIYDHSHATANRYNPTTYRMSTVNGLLTSKKDRKFGNWSVVVDADGYRYINHYTTCMLVLRPNLGFHAPTDNNSQPTGLLVVDYSVGHCSVSDQDMMNRLFRALPDCELYYSRDRKGGGARIN